MSVLHPAFLWALPVGLIPIIIYYLLRFRALKVTWGANYVLERALERLKKRLRLDQLLLLAVRILICLALVLAFARPFAAARSPSISGSGVQHVLILDGSYSMRAGPAGRNCWTQSLAALKSLIQTWGRGERWSLLLLGDTPRWVVDDATVTAPEKTLQLVASLQTSESTVKMSAALDLVARKFPGAQVELTIFADDQASTWEGTDTTALPAMVRGPVYWVNPRLENRQNLAVTAVAPAGERPLVGHPCRVFVAVKNFGPEAVQDAPVDLLADGAVSGRELISLLAGQEGWVHFDVAFRDPGSHHVTARLAPDALDYDNRMSAGLEVADKYRVLVLRDRDHAGKFDSAWGFLEVLGRVQTITRDGATVFDMGPLTFTLADAEPDPAALAHADVVLLDGGKALTPTLVARLRDFVHAGGGLLLAADQKVDPAAWNRQLADAGLLPAPLDRGHIEQLGGATAASLARNEFASGSLRPFETDENGDLANAQFFAWYDFGPLAKNTDVLARFADRAPYALRLRLARGSVIQLAAGLNGRDNNLVVREFYLPLLFRLVSEAAAGGICPRTTAVRTPLDFWWKDAPDVKACLLSLDGADARPVTFRQRDGLPQVAVPEGLPTTGLASLLVVRGEGTKQIYMGIQGPRVDSDLTPLAPELRKKLLDRWRLVVAADWPELDTHLQTLRAGREWYAIVLATVLTFLLLEMFLQRRFVMDRK